MNKYQKRVLVAAGSVVFIFLLYWYSQGADVFTKTKVIVDVTTDLDKMLGIENKVYTDGFVFGLLPAGFSISPEAVSVASVTGLIAVLSGILIYKFRKKGKMTA